MNYTQLVVKVKKITNEYRGILKSLEGQKIALLWDKLPEDERTKLITAAISGDKTTVQTIINSKELGEVSVRELRSLAKSLGLKYYCTKTRIELIRELTK